MIIEDGIERMYKKGESIFYYITVMNEPYAMPAMPDGAREGILKGMYRYSAPPNAKSKLRAQLFGSGAILREAIRAQEILEEKYDVAADVWSITSYKDLYYDGLETERWNLLHPGEETARALRHAMPRRRAGRARGRLGLPEGAAKSRQPVDAAPPGLAWHGRIWPQREQAVTS